MYEVRLSQRADYYYRQVDRDTARGLNLVFEELSDNPYNVRNVRLLRSREGLLRYRLGDLRILFGVEHADQIVRIVAIGPRKDIYIKHG